jgi:2-methylcitrate dehydratase PrpD
MNSPLTLSQSMALSVVAMRYDRLPAEVVAKVKIALLDYLSCAYEAMDLPFARQAMERARAASGGVGVVGSKTRTSVGEAAFANAVLGHGLVREDMHTGSVSHLGVVVFPSLLALAQTLPPEPVTGRRFIASVVCGYEIACVVGRALMDAENVRLFRPTGICGPLGAAAAGARMMTLDEGGIASAMALAANTASGFNEWPREGADDMYFHVGFAARNAVTAVELAAMGAYGSATSIEGLFRALRREERLGQVHPFADGFEIMQVYHKPAPACNYAQTACQAALALAQAGVKAGDVASIAVRGTGAALNYPGCSADGPFERVLQAKMSIRYCVAATLRNGEIAEANYRMLDDAEIARLMSVTALEEDAALTAAYPKQQGASVEVTLRDGTTMRRALADVVPATGAQIRERFAAAADKVLGSWRRAKVESLVDELETLNDVTALTAVLGTN